MAEFQEVMRQWGRYCNGYTENHNDDCDGCSLEINGSCNSYAKDNAQYAKQIEKHIMAWAAEHPEPVYPTWFEYLYAISNPDYFDLTEFYTWMRHTPIPTDIAQKLGIDPREATP